jgi:hypothetical protein
VDGVGYYVITFPVSVRRTILPRGSYKFTAKKKLSTQLSVPNAQPQFELSLSELNHMHLCVMFIGKSYMYVQK